MTREAAQERGRGGQINPAGGVSEADMLAAAVVGRRHAALGAAADRKLKELDAAGQVSFSRYITESPVVSRCIRINGVFSVCCAWMLQSRYIFKLDRRISGYAS